MINGEVNNITIVGGGSAGWMTAAALSRMFGTTHKITLIESEEIGIIGVGEATIPSIHLFHQLLGLDENEFLRETKGSIKLGIEFVNWYEVGHRYMHAFGTIGKDTGMVQFHNYWLKSYLNDPKDDLWKYSLNYQAAKHNKFERPEKVNCAPLDGMPWAYHFDASLYAKYLRKYAEAKGVKRIEGKIVDTKLDAETGYIANVVMENGTEVDGDLFVDCSGFRSLLMGKALGVKFLDYTDILPVNRACYVPCEGVSPITPYTRATAQDAGWSWRIPLQHRIGNGYVYCADYISDDEACSVLLRNLDGPALADPNIVKFGAGRREYSFHKNCVAIGLSNGFLEPLESTAIHFIQGAIARLIALMPVKGIDKNLVDEFNEQGATEFDMVRDFIVLHYVAQSSGENRLKSKFWDDRQKMPIPETLRHKMDLFRNTGILSPNMYDLFKYPSWLQVLVGQGVIPQNPHAYANSIDVNNLQGYLGSIRQTINNAVASLPLHDDFLKQAISN